MFASDNNTNKLLKSSCLELKDFKAFILDYNVNFFFLSHQWSYKTSYSIDPKNFLQENLMLECAEFTDRIGLWVCLFGRLQRCLQNTSGQTLTVLLRPTISDEQKKLIYSQA